MQWKEVEQILDREQYDESYGLRDVQLGDIVTVNGINLYAYNADLIEYEPVQVSISSDLVKKVGGHSYLINEHNIGNNGITMKFYIGGTNAQQAQVNYNKVIHEFKKDIVVINISDTEFEYVGVLQTMRVQHTSVLHYYLLEVTLVAVKRLPAITAQYDTWDGDEGIEIENDGVIETGLLVAVQSSMAGEEIEISLYEEGSETPYYTATITNADDYEYHVIDGLEGKVLCGTTAQGVFVDPMDDTFPTYQNNFANTVLYEFPNLRIGQNRLAITGGVEGVALKYYPLFLV